MFLIPVTLRQANDFVEQFHRHNGRTSRDGGKWAVGVSDGEELIGVGIVGRPLARLLDDGWTAEVLRVCCREGKPNCASMIYGACWRAWRAMGGQRLVTYTLQTETGGSLRAAGFKVVAECKPGKWNREKAGRFREYQPIYGQAKFRWEATSGEN
jgi:hypothetical protein